MRRVVRGIGCVVAALLAMTTRGGAQSSASRDSTTAKPTSDVHTSYSWWVDATFTPTDSSVEGIPARVLDPTWRRVIVLRRDRLPADASSEPAGLADSSVAFVIDGDFNHDGRADRALVGTYETDDGQFGRFFLILTRRRGHWTKAFLSLDRGRPGFGAILRDGDHLLWLACMDCDSYDTIAWTGREYDTLPAPDAE